MYYVGVDLHKATSWFYVLDARGKQVDSKNLSNDLAVLKGYFETIPVPFTLAVESTYNWYYFVDLAETYADEVFLANSYELKAFAKRHKKTDKIDAQLIAQVLYKGYLPIVTIADQQTRQIRELLRCRMNLVRDRSRTISRLKALLDKLGIYSEGDFTTYKRLGGIPIEAMSSIYGTVAKHYIEQIIESSRRLFEMEKAITTLSNRDTEVSHLISIPGIGPFSALLIKSEIMDISRFASFNRLCAYAGLAPRVSASANKIHHGPLNKNRRKYLQWILIEDAYHYIRSVPEAKEKYAQVEKRKGANTAKIVIAREMLKVVYHVLKENRPYYTEGEKRKQQAKKQKEKGVKIQSVATAALLGV